MAKILKIDLDPTNKRLASSYKDNGILQRQVLHMAIAGIVEDSNYIEVVLQNCPVISDKAIGDPTSGRLVYIKQSHLWRLT